MIAMVMLAGLASADEKTTRTSSIAWSAQEVKRVEIQVPPSEISIRSAPIDRIQLSAEWRVETRGDEAEWMSTVLDGLTFEAVRKDSRLIIRDKREGEARSSKARRRDTEAKIVVTVPDWTSVEVRQTAGEVSLKGNLENVLVSMRAGEIRMEGPASHVRRLEARARIGEVKTEVGARKESREGVFAGTALWENPDPEARATVELLLTVGEITVDLY